MFKMNTEIRKSKVIFTRRLAQQLQTDENETTLENFSNGANGNTEDCGISLKLKTDENETRLENFSNGANGHTEERGTSSRDGMVGVDPNDDDVDPFIVIQADDLKKSSYQFYPFSAIDFISINVSVVFFCIDFLTDILLAKDYYDEGMMFECALTSSLVAASFLVTGILSFFWHAQEKPRRHLCLVFLTFPFATIERYTR